MSLTLFDSIDRAKTTTCLINAVFIPGFVLAQNGSKTRWTFLALSLVCQRVAEAWLLLVWIKKHKQQEKFEESE